MKQYHDALDHLNAAMLLIDDIDDTQVAAELSAPLYTLKRRITSAPSIAEEKTPNPDR